MLRKRFILLLLSGVLASTAPFSALRAQEERHARWEESIRAFERQDREQGFPRPGVIVFTGSSSVRGWESLKDDMSPLPVINRGFGGSQLDDAVYFANRIVIPYLPSRVVLYSGDNDIANGKSPETVAADFRAFVERLRGSIPGIPVYFLSVKPSIARWKHWENMRKTNDLIRDFCAKDSLLFYVDAASVLLGADGRPDAALFQEDGLHLNAAGYGKWTAVLKPLLAAPLAEQGE